MASRRVQKLLDTGVRAPEFGMAAPTSGPILLVFFKVTCPVCQLTLPYLQRLHDAGGITVIGVSQNTFEDTLEFTDYYRITFPTILDAEDDNFPVSNAYGISSVPTSFLIEPDGMISRVIEGWQKAEIEALGQRVNAAIIQPTDNVPRWKAG